MSIVVISFLQYKSKITCSKIATKTRHNNDCVIRIYVYIQKHEFIATKKMFWFRTSYLWLVLFDAAVTIYIGHIVLTVVSFFLWSHSRFMQMYNGRETTTVKSRQQRKTEITTVFLIINYFLFLTVKYKRVPRS